MINDTGEIVLSQQSKCTILDDITLFSKRKVKEVRTLINDSGTIALSRRIIKEA